MKEIVKVGLENEMDLILAHKRAMKLCELTGFSLIAQTLIATAVSEIARCAIDHGTAATLRLGIDREPGGKKYIKAVIADSSDFTPSCSDAYKYAKRLVNSVETVKSGNEVQIGIRQQVTFGGTITDTKIESFINYFKNEPPLSAYDEFRRKNALLKELAEKIKDSEADYRVLTDSLPLMMFSVNSNGIITYTNKWLQDFLGPIPKELTSKAWMNYLHPDDYSPFSKELQVALHKLNGLTGQYRFRQKSTGAFLWHIISVNPLTNEAGAIIRWIGFIVDINAQKLVEQTLKDNRQLKDMQKLLFRNQDELQQKIVQLNRSNYELEQFAHLASHDLQEPLRKIFFYSDVLKEKYAAGLDENVMRMLQNIGYAAGRMKELIDDLLSYSKLQQQKISFEKVALDHILQETLKDLDIAIKEKNATVSAVPLPQIEGNPVTLRQLFSNLISNSLKYAKVTVPPHIEITCGYVQDAVKICVKDNGIGFEEEYRERIFGLFERLHNRDQFPGTGIGLSICRRIAELHHGQISAYSRPTEYALFEITLPLRQHLTLRTA